ncbi:RING-H2 finger protein ATL56-like [Magnolia sinica]|uniref:RING-H2 finger protein ATL56-like n=1 Tax=Magnolia sinica TaxID=86752 RepID=UPI00265B35C4|nr:RING-H2 finger protein ATL56-like [Magnolia sinica]
MPSEEEAGGPVLIEFNPNRPNMAHPLSSIPSPPPSSSSPPSPAHHLPISSPTVKTPNPRLLSFFLQALVMALSISLFFLFVVIAALLLLHICVAGSALRRRSHSRRTLHRLQPPDRSDLRSGLSLKALDNLPCFHHVAGPSSDCAVCLDVFCEGDRCRLLPGCSHSFHAACVDTWLVKVPACPICRTSVVQ